MVNQKFFSFRLFNISLESTCSKKLLWSNHNQVIKQSVSGEAWSKGWPDRKQTQINQEEFIRNFKWLDAWSSIHLKYISKIIIPYSIFLLILGIFINFFRIEKFKKFEIQEADKKKYFIYFSFNNFKHYIFYKISLIQIWIFLPCNIINHFIFTIYFKN